MKICFVAWCCVVDSGAIMFGCTMSMLLMVYIFVVIFILVNVYCFDLYFYCFDLYFYYEDNLKCF